MFEFQKKNCKRKTSACNFTLTHFAADTSLSSTYTLTQIVIRKQKDDRMIGRINERNEKKQHEMFLIKLFIKALTLCIQPLMRSAASGSEYFIFIRYLALLSRKHQCGEKKNEYKLLNILKPISLN